MDAEDKPRIGVSACLLGVPVRYDGGHKRVAWVVDALAAECELVAICPETAIGLGTPRPPIQLVAHAGAVRAHGVADPTVDVTDALRAYARDCAVDYADLSGYIFKSRSPSCALTDAPVAGRDGATQPGIFAGALSAAAPLLPTIDEASGADANVRAHFIERVFALRRWQRFRAAPLAPAGLIAFHTKHKLTVMAHDEATYRTLGRMLADVPVARLPQIADEYATRFMYALAQPVHVGRHVDVLMHAVGFLKDALTAADKRAFGDTLLQFRNGDCGLDEAIRQLRGFLQRHPQAYVAQQSYVAISPAEWRLRFESAPPDDGAMLG